MSTQPLTPAEEIELATLRRMLKEELDPRDSDEYAALLQSATDAITFGTMTKEAALSGLVECLIVRLKGLRRDLEETKRTQP